MTATQEAAPEPRSQVTARRTRGLIAELQLEQRRIAARLGMSQPHLSRKVNGRVPFTMDELEELAPILGVTEEYLYGFTDERSPLRTVPGGGSLFVGSRYGIRDSNPEPADSVPAAVLPFRVIETATLATHGGENISRSAIVIPLRRSA